MEEIKQLSPREVAIQQALAVPHNLLVSDQILKLKSQNEQIQVTLGWGTPAGTFAPTATLVITKAFARQLIDELQKAIA